MAGVDALLNLVVAQGADALFLVAGEIPSLRKGAEARDLSMPPLQEALFRRFVSEMEEHAEHGLYCLAAKGGEVRFRVSIDGGRAMELRLADAPAAPSLSSPEAGGESPFPAGGPTGGPDGDPAGGPTHLVGLVDRALQVEAIDLFLSTASDARMRVGRELEEIPGTRCTEEEILELTGLRDGRQSELESHGSVDLSLDFAAGRVRANVFQHQAGLAAVLRPIRRSIRSLAELGLPSDLQALTEHGDGLVLMVGPTGSGKSSTLAALIDHLNATQSRHVVTIEDPIEFTHENDRSLIHQRELGRHVKSFAAGLRAALREGPDVILVGEMRDPETIAAALTAAETGHLVLSTLHSGSASMAIDRIIDSFPAHQQSQVRWQLAGVLRAIVTQLLIPSVRPGALVPAVEKLIVTHAVAANIRDGRGHHIGSQIQTGRDEGMISLELSLAELTRRGEISRETALAAARNPDLLRDLLLRA